MVGGVLKILSLLFVLTTLLNHPVDSAALPSPHHDNNDAKGHSHAQDSEVRELESLKEPPNEGDSVQVVKTHSTVVINDESGKHTEQMDLRDYIDRNGKLVAGVHQTSESSKVHGEPGHHHTSTEIEIPSEGIHKTVTQDSDDDNKENKLSGAAGLLQSSGEGPQSVQLQSQPETTQNGNRRSFNADITQEEANNVDHFAAYTGVQYSPLDMAEYIFWTGDEKGVTNAIENFLQEGLMTREDAIGFLQEIKYNIEYLQAHYSAQRNHGLFDDKMQQNPQAFPGDKFNHENMLKAIIESNYERNNNLAPPLLLPQMPFNMPDMNRNAFNKRNIDPLNQNNFKPGGFNNFLMDPYETEPSPTVSEEEYDEFLEKLKMADFMHTENSLQEMVYQLSKIMLAQSLSHGAMETQQVLQKFTNYLEIESDQGRLSKSLEKKILDVLIEALTDTLSEHPELAYLTQNEYANTLNNKIFSKYAENKQGSKNAAALLNGNLLKAGNIPKPNHQPGWVMNQMKNIQLQPVKRFKIAA